MFLNSDSQSVLDAHLYLLRFPDKLSTLNNLVCRDFDGLDMQCLLQLLDPFSGNQVGIDLVLLENPLHQNFGNFKFFGDFLVRGLVCDGMLYDTVEVI